MPILKTIGSIANGWAKFGVALVGLGWFGMATLNRLAPAQEIPVVESESSLDSEETPNTTSSDMEGQLSSESETSVVSSIASELGDSATGFLGNHRAQLTLLFLAGLGVGLAGRPVVTHINQKRKLLAAKRRLKRMEEDRQLLAMVSSGTLDEMDETQHSTSLASRQPSSDTPKEATAPQV